MTYEEAKNHLNRIQRGFALVLEFGSVEEAIEHFSNFKDIEIILKVLEKQMPKKPMVWSDHFGDLTLVCPSCEKPITNVWSNQNYKPKYCHYCGQRLDWSE